MKSSIIKQLSLVSMGVALVCSSLGCAERISESSSYRSGKNWAEARHTEVDKYRNGSYEIDKDVWRERYICLKNGKYVKSTTGKHCRELGGKVYFEVIKESTDIDRIPVRK